MKLNEYTVEDPALEWFAAPDYAADLQDEAVKTVLAQAELLSAGWAEG